MGCSAAASRLRQCAKPTPLATMHRRMVPARCLLNAHTLNASFVVVAMKLVMAMQAVPAPAVPVPVADGDTEMEDEMAAAISLSMVRSHLLSS